MKKLQIAIAIILILLAMLGCGKAIENPIENYISTKKEKFRFNQNSFGLQYWDGIYWYPCEKEGDFRDGYIAFKNKGYDYRVNKDTVRLFVSTGSDLDPLLLKHTLILDRSQRNVYGIFQRK